MEDRKRGLEDILAVARGTTDLQKMVVQTTPEPDTHFELKAFLREKGISIGRSYEIQEIVLRGRLAMVRNDLAGLLSHCLASGLVMKRLAAASTTQDEMREVASGLVIDAVLEVAGNARW